MSTNISIVSSVVIGIENRFFAKIDVYDSKGNFLFSKTWHTVFSDVTKAATKANIMNNEYRSNFNEFKSFSPII